MIVMGTTHSLKLIQIGDSVGVILPNEMLAQLRLRIGDEFYLTETPDGYRIVTQSSDFEEQMRIGRQIMKDHREVFRELAKK